VPMLQHGLTKGTAEQKREAAQCYADLLRLVDRKYVQMVIVKIAGPLIRVLGDRYLPKVRASVLDALVLLQDMGGRMLKAFVAQMQTSLVKNLKDAYDPIRATALKSLKRLLRMSPRIDALVRIYCCVARQPLQSRKWFSRSMVFFCGWIFPSRVGTYSVCGRAEYRGPSRGRRPSWQLGARFAPHSGGDARQGVHKDGGHFGVHSSEAGGGRCSRLRWRRR